MCASLSESNKKLLYTASTKEMRIIYMFIDLGSWLTSAMHEGYVVALWAIVHTLFVLSPDN